MSVGCPKCGSSKVDSDLDYKCPKCGYILWRSKKIYERHVKGYKYKQQKIEEHNKNNESIEKQQVGIKKFNIASNGKKNNSEIKFDKRQIAWTTFCVLFLGLLLYFYLSQNNFVRIWKFDVILALGVSFAGYVFVLLVYNLSSKSEESLLREASKEKKRLGINKDLITRIKNGTVDIEAICPQRLFTGDFLLISNRFGLYVLKIIISLVVIVILTTVISSQEINEQKASQWADRLWQVFLVYALLLTVGYVYGYFRTRDNVKKYDIITNIIGNEHTIDKDTASKSTKILSKIRCSECGKKIDDDSKFCIHCGSKISR